MIIYMHHSCHSSIEFIEIVKHLVKMQEGKNRNTPSEIFLPNCALNTLGWAKQDLWGLGAVIVYCRSVRILPVILYTERNNC
jgi:hypothetical protein